MEITFTNVNHIYMPKTPFEHTALKNINLHIPSGHFVAIIGHTGSGKSTIVQHINGLLKPSTGTIKVGPYTIDAHQKNKHLKALRSQIGMVFQYPEHQLFDETVEKDLLFGPINFGFSKEEALAEIKRLLPLVGIDESLLQRSPFDLSGGQKRRVAIAGVLASNPKVLILDEPTAGLDPLGRHNMMELFRTIHRQQNLTTVFVTHNMEFAAMYADLVVVMEKGSIVMQGPPQEVFCSIEPLRSLGLDVPDTVQFAMMINERFQTNLRTDLYTIDDIAEEMIRILAKGN